MNSELSQNLLADIRNLITKARAQAARQLNSSLVILYWQVGKRIQTEILKNERATYGEQLIKNLANELCKQYGNNFNHRALFRMVKLAKCFPDEDVLVNLSQQLSWSHFIEITGIDDNLKQKFYTQLCRLEHWSVRELRKKIDGMLYERTAISQQPEDIIKESLNELQVKDELNQDIVFRDPYILDFLDLPANYSEETLENAILDELCNFLKELGTDFCFIARQKRITIDNDDYYIDLLFFHRGLKRLVAIELKLGKFTASHKGQVELYLRWLNKYERREGENEPLGLILCAEKKHEHIELLELDKSGIHVAQYLTELPPRNVLEEKLRKSIALAKEKHARLDDPDKKNN